MQIFARLSKILSDVMGAEDIEYTTEDSMLLLTSNAGLTAEDQNGHRSQKQQLESVDSAPFTFCSEPARGEGACKTPPSTLNLFWRKRLFRAANKS